MSSTSVADVLTLPALRGAHVLAGREGLGRVVTGVNVMEVPDIEDYVVAGELLLTTAYPVRDRPERLVELLNIFATRGLAAIAIKPLRYLDRLPDQLVTEADRLGFPVLVLRDDTAFNEVIGAVLAVVLAEYGPDPGGADAIRERLTGVALAGGGLEEIARTLAGALDRSVTIVDHDNESLGRAEPDGRTNGPTPASDDQIWAFPITVAGATRGNVLVAGSGEPTLGQRRLIRQSCFAAGMHIAQAVAGLELDRRLRVLFLEEIVTGPSIDEPTLRQRSGLFGWDLAGKNVVLVARCTFELSDLSIAAAARSALPPGTLSWSRGSEVLAIVPLLGSDPRSDRRDATHLTGDPPWSLPTAWREALLHAGAGSPVIAAGSVETGPSRIADSHSAAREALRIAQMTSRTVVRHGDLALERLILAMPPALRAEFVDQQIGGLIKHKEATKGDLCATLAAYLGVGNGAEAARRLYIHYNTMKHRLARIAGLTGADLHDPRTRLALALALEVYDLT